MQSLLPEPNRSSRERHTFLLLLIMAFLFWHLWMTPQQPPQKPVDIDKPLVQDKQNDSQKPEESASPDETANAPHIPDTKTEPAWITLGSMDSKSPYQMLVTLTNQGAAVARIELNTPQYRDVQELSGYLGQIIVDQTLAEQALDGVAVQVVGPGTPAQKFGLQVNDKITQIDFKNRMTGKSESVSVKTFDDLRNALLLTKPNDYIELSLLRGNHQIEGLKIQLSQYPMDVIRPESAPKDYEEYRLMGGLRGFTEKSDQLSFLTTLQQIDGLQLDLPASQNIDNSKQLGLIPPDPTLDIELPNVALRSECWKLDSSSESKAVFRRTVPNWNLEVIKTYELNRRDSSQFGTGYELTINIEVKNLDSKEHKIAYQFDGPTGLPLEGGWYARKTGPGWGSYGIRDLVIRLPGNAGRVVSNNEVNIDKVDHPWIDVSPDYIGVDSLFFQCTLKPDTAANVEPQHSKVFPIRVGTKNTDWSMLTDISYRLLSKENVLQPNEAIEHQYSVFVGPKDTAILATHGLGETISYGWFWFAAQPLLGILHFFHGLGMSYAMAIIALTIGVRLLLFPLSIKQAVGAIKMAAIQPELKALAEKYKDDMQARSRAQSELFKRHGYHPLSGCLPIFIQLPVFIGLYKALSIDAGLYGTPLFSSTIRWCSDLSAPDMLIDWSGFWTSWGWTSFNMGQGILTLGPYFNLLPMLTIVLFLIQQAVMMPPPTDDQSRMQRKMMQYMMVFMGLMFFKVPSGLCLYFVVSTVWGLLERRFIPKVQPSVANTTYDVQPTAMETKKPMTKKRNEKQPAKPEGAFRKWLREIMEKAAEQQKLGTTNKQDKKKKKR